MSKDFEETHLNILVPLEFDLSERPLSGDFFFFFRLTTIEDNFFLRFCKE